MPTRLGVLYVRSPVESDHMTRKIAQPGKHTLTVRSSVSRTDIPPCLFVRQYQPIFDQCVQFHLVIPARGMSVLRSGRLGSGNVRVSQYPSDHTRRSSETPVFILGNFIITHPFCHQLV